MVVASNEPTRQTIDGTLKRQPAVCNLWYTRSNGDVIWSTIETLPTSISTMNWFGMVIACLYRVSTQQRSMIMMMMMINQFSTDCLLPFLVGVLGPMGPIFD